MDCPVCGSPMNHHADKVEYAQDLPHAGDGDAALGGVICQIHTCRKCGHTEAVREGDSSGHDKLY